MSPYIDTYRELPLWYWYIVGGLLTLALVLYIYSRVRQPAELLAFRTERGEVTVVRRAITDLIQKAAARTPGVDKCKSRIQSRKGKLRILLRIHLRANYDLREVERRLETQIAETLRYSLGFTSLGRIDTRVVRLVGDPEAVLSFEKRPEPEDREDHPHAREDVRRREREERQRREAARYAYDEDGDDEPKALPPGQPESDDLPSQSDGGKDPAARI